MKHDHRPYPAGATEMQKVLNIILENGRALEWGASVGLMSLAVTMALPGETLMLNGLSTFKGMGLDDAACGVILGVIATARIAALYINGLWRRSPLVRMFGGILGASIYSMLAIGFSWPYLVGENPALSGAPGIYTTLALFDALSIYRSGGDVRLAKRILHV